LGGGNGSGANGTGSDVNKVMSRYDRVMEFQIVKSFQNRIFYTFFPFEKYHRYCIYCWISFKMVTKYLFGKAIWLLFSLVIFFQTNGKKSCNFKSISKSKKWISDQNYETFLFVIAKEIVIVHRFSLVKISYCVGTCRVKQKQKKTHVGGFVDFYSNSCSK